MARPKRDKEAALQMTVAFEFKPVGSVTLRQDRLKFPRARARAQPAVYRFKFVGPRGRPMVYIGETSKLTDRLTGYKNPGKDQTTNQRIHNAIREHLGKRKREVVLEAAYRVKVRDEKRRLDVDLSEKAARGLAENAAIVQALHEGLKILNR